MQSMTLKLSTDPAANTATLMHCPESRESSVGESLMLRQRRVTLPVPQSEPQREVITLQLVVPSKYREQIVMELHAGAIGGHLVVEKMHSRPGSWWCFFIQPLAQILHLHSGNLLCVVVVSGGGMSCM